jgi:signal transduction histidine kinase
VNGLRRRLERRAFLAAAEVELKNRHLGVALERLKDAQARFVATEKLSAVGRLLAQLSHEINNPMHVVQSNLEPVAEHAQALVRVADLARSVDGPAGVAVQQAWRDADLDFVRTDISAALDDMRTACGRIKGLHLELRAFLRGDSPLAIEADLNDSVKTTVALCRRNLPRGVQLVEQYGEVPKLLLVPGQLGQVVLNLVQNALDAVGAEGSVEVGTRLDGGAVELWVADTGPGLAPEARARLFEPFFTTKPVGQGTGLGLATSYQIIAQHGGTLELDGQGQRGTKFVARLPLKAPAPPTPRSGSGTAPPP